MLLAAVMLMALWLQTTAPPTTTTNCILREGIGADFGKIGLTKQGSAGPVPPGVRLEYKNNVVVEIFVGEGECRTLKGARIGDSEGKVQKLYGPGKRTSASLMKGASSAIGKLGDYILEYPGVAFVMSKGQVAAIFIRSAH